MIEMETNPKENRLIKWIKKDFIVVTICLVCLLGCLYTLLTIGEYQNQCNEYWIKQIKQCQCDNYVKEFDTNFSFTMDYGDETNGDQDRNQNPSR